jgi:hypothetical protein
MKATIYLAVNRVNGKQYVGKISERTKEAMRRPEVREKFLAGLKRKKEKKHNALSR